MLFSAGEDRAKHHIVTSSLRLSSHYLSQYEMLLLMEESLPVQLNEIQFNAIQSNAIQSNSIVEEAVVEEAVAEEAVVEGEGGE